MIIEYLGIGLTNGGLFKIEIAAANINYYALFVDSEGGVFATDFPLWAVVTRQEEETVTDNFILPVTSLFASDILAALTSYIGYCPKDKLPVGTPIKDDCGFNKYMPSAVIDPVKDKFDLIV
ncbi:hypothetical protein [Nostoc sp. JL23]|uniref:hypothetical protein n=1 Tax=Nostoc sp. JL23 TaxID=2815394 RepID=UPI001DE8774F|nr:hypothetical protein [Nostoc sp. JL23]MBN3875257.1 hypothetical protein [Nostoc sp. JL23]